MSAVGENATMPMSRRQHRGELKAKVVLEALRGERTINELAAAYGVPAMQITPWQRVAWEEFPTLLSSRRSTKPKDEAARHAALYHQLGQLPVERDWLKKKSAISVEEQRAWLEPGPPPLSLRRQCRWLGLARSSLDYQAVPARVADLPLRRLLDEHYLATPLSGVRRMTAWRRCQGYGVNHTRGARLMRQIGVEAIYPKPRLSQPAAGHVLSPSLLRGVTVHRVTQVWSADSTYVRLVGGLVSLVAVRDWVSRYVLSWAVSITMAVAWCVEALEQAIRHGQLEIVTTDPGVQFTRLTLTERLQHRGIRLRMEGRGRALDHVFVERLGRRVKDEEVYRRDDQSVWDARQSLARYFGFYNGVRRHQARG
jgi:putative transposase